MSSATSRIVIASPPFGCSAAPRHRDSLYTAEAIEALRAICEAAGYLWSRRLKALLPLWMPWARRRLRLRPTVERQVLAISPRQMDRRVGPAPPPASEAAVRPHQAQHPAQAPLPPQDRPLGTHNPAGFADDRFTQRRGLFLSVGQKKMVAIARATRSNARSTARGGDQRHEGLLRRPKTQNFAMPAHTKVVQKQCGWAQSAETRVGG